LAKNVLQEKLELSRQTLLRWNTRIKDNEALIREIWEDPSLRPAHLPQKYFLTEIAGLEHNIKLFSELANNLSSDIQINMSRIQELSGQIEHLEETEQRTKEELDIIIINLLINSETYELNVVICDSFLVWARRFIEIP
jgi:hypothetical protein